MIRVKDKPVTEPRAKPVTRVVTPRQSVTVGVTHCPTCGQKVVKKHASAAERQRAYRERKKKEHVSVTEALTDSRPPRRPSLPRSSSASWGGSGE